MSTLTQTAYRKGISCAESIFASQEAVRVFTSLGDHVYSSFYDLQSAFDKVGYPVLLEELFKAGLRGKFCRIFKQWYSNPTSCVSHLVSCFISTLNALSMEHPGYHDMKG